MNDSFNRYLSNECSQSDFDSVIKLMVSPEKESILENQMQEHWGKTTGKGDVPDLSGTLYRIHYHISKSENTGAKNTRFIHYFSRVAAILILPLLIALGYLLKENSSEDTLVQTVSSPLAARTSFVLPDGSKVWLNAGSTISFPVHFTDSQRAVKLSGQAYFDVIKNKKPFRVETESFSVEVLGTTFDVSAYNQEKASVTLVRGKVAVGMQTGGKAILDPGQQAFIENGQIQKRNVDPNLFVSWKDNLLVFNEEPLDEVALKLERWYNLDISIDDESIKKIHVTGTFRYESISEILQLMEITDSITYSYNKDKRMVILKHK